MASRAAALFDRRLSSREGGEVKRRIINTLRSSDYGRANTRQNIVIQQRGNTRSKDDKPFLIHLSTCMLFNFRQFESLTDVVKFSDVADNPLAPHRHSL